MSNKIFILFMVFLLASCSGSKVSTSSSTTNDYSNGFSGVAQKGPLIYGSYVTVYLLDSNLNPTGQSYEAQTTDDLGNFSINSNISSNLVEMVATGYYMDELTGSLSSSPITLNAYADLSIDATPTINVLTTLQAPRVKVLISQGLNYSAALQQSATEVLSVFGINSALINNYQSLFGMQINGSGDQDSALLAASTVLAQMSSDAALAGSSPASQMSYYLSRIASDVANNGKLVTASIQTALTKAETEINKTQVRSNIQSYYASRGVTMTPPKFEEWIDSDANGILPLRIVPASGFSFVPLTGATPGNVYSSNTVTVSGLGSGIVSLLSVTPFICTSLSPTCSFNIIKNGTALSSNVNSVSVTDGDTLSFQGTALGYGQTNTAYLTLGATSTTWSVSSTSLGGTISGLTGNGLILSDGSGNNVSVQPGSSSFALSSTYPIGTNYSITVSSQPSNPAQFCSVSNGSGTVGTTTAQIAINCSSAKILVTSNDNGSNTLNSYFVSSTTGEIYFSQSTNLTLSGSNSGALAYLQSLNLLYASTNLFNINKATGAFTNALNTGPDSGSGLTSNYLYQIGFDPTGHFAYITNTISPQGISLNSIDQSTGSLTNISKTNVPISAGTDSSLVDPSGRYIFVTNNSSNTLYVYPLNSGTGALGSYTTTGLNSSPQAIAIDPNSKFFYTIYPNLDVYSINDATGSLTYLNTYSDIPSGFFPRAITVNPNGKYVYVSYVPNLSPNSTPSGILVYSVNSSGGLTKVGAYSMSSPMTNYDIKVLAVDSQGLYLAVAGGTLGTSGSVAIYSINQSNGQLSLTGTASGGFAYGGLFIPN